MPRPYKPNVDWTAIETAWLTGVKSSELAKSHPVSRQAIDQRATREGWGKDGIQPQARKRKVWTQAAASLPSLAELVDPQTHKQKLLAAYGNRTAENLGQILESMAAGLPREIACRGVGFTTETLRHWEVDDPEVRGLITKAQVDKAQFYTGAVDKAVSRGDWRAAAFKLAQDPFTRPIYAQANSINGGGPTINVNISIPDPQGRQVMIDVTPAQLPQWDNQVSSTASDTQDNEIIPA